MKRTLLLAGHFIMFSAACKKAKKEPPVGIDTILGSWEIESQTAGVEQTGYTFKADRSYSKYMGGFIGIENGVYQLHTTSDPKKFEVIFTRNGTQRNDTLIAEIPSYNQLSLNYKLTRWNYVRVK